MMEPALHDDEYSSHGNYLLEEIPTYDDFPLEEFKEDSFNTSRSFEEDNTSNNDAWVQLLNLPPTNHQHATGVPVGGMRRVSSCYFSIASNISSDDNPSHNLYSSFVTPNPSYHSRHHSHHYDALSFEGRKASDFLLHDVLMNVFSFLDAQSLASFSETARRPNFECFYFLELQLQRALLMGEGHNHLEEGVEEDKEEDDDGDYLSRNDDSEEEQDAAEEWESDEESHDDEDIINELANRDVIPSFEGSIVGTGVISRLASLDSTNARKIVQTYLDSNTSIHAMPLSHSLAYFRQVLMRGGRNPLFCQTPSRMSSQPPLPNIPENMAKNARNMALFFTFLGAAYMHAQQGGDVPPSLPTMPDPSEVLNEENMEALKGMMLKVGLAGGFFKAGQTMKEKAEMKQNYNMDDQRTEGGHQLESVMEGAEEANENGEDVDGTSPGAVAVGRPPLQARTSLERRSGSIGGLEDLSQMMYPSAIASRFFNAISNSNSGTATEAACFSPSTSTSNLDAKDHGGNNASLSPPRKHRDKRSHATFSQSDSNSAANRWEETKSSEPVGGAAAAAEAEEEANFDPSDAPIHEEHKIDESPEAIAFAMDHPFSPNPYDHPPPSSFPNMAAEDKIAATDAAAVVVAAKSFFSFNVAQESMSTDDSNVPTGCVGAYAHAVKTAATELTRLIKARRKSNFDALSPSERLERGVRFIDACTSDDKLPIVKRLLPCMDVDRFFIGPDDTETCALHAAAFNGAECVLRFLCGGIDERDSFYDRGLCDVNIRDANGWSALHFAAGANSVKSVEVLAGHGAKLTIEASNGYTPYHWAERLSNEEVAVELEKLGADNRFVGRWMFGGGTGGDDRKIPFVSFLANRFFGFNR